MPFYGQHTIIGMKYGYIWKAVRIELKRKWIKQMIQRVVKVHRKITKKVQLVLMAQLPKKQSTICLGLSGGFHLVPLGESLKQTGCYRIETPCHWGTLNQFDYPYFLNRNSCKFFFLPEWPKYHLPHTCRCPAGLLVWKVAKNQKG